MSQEKEGPLIYASLKSMTIIYAEDQQIVRTGIRFFLNKQPNFEVIAEAANGYELLTLLKDGVRANIILTDMQMPGLSWHELVNEIKVVEPESKIVLLTGQDEDQEVVKAFKAGVDGYLLKSVGPIELAFGLRHVYTGEKYICSALSTRILDHCIQTAFQVTVPKVGTALSDLELEVLTLVAEGYTNQEMADALFTSKRTIESRRESLLRKLNVTNTAALIKKALLDGLI